MSKDGDVYMKAGKHVHAGVCVYNGHDLFRMAEMAEMVRARIHVGASCPLWGHVYMPCMHVVHACEHVVHSHHAAMGTHHVCLQSCVGVHVLVVWMLGQGTRCGDTWRGQHMWTKLGHVDNGQDVWMKARTHAQGPGCMHEGWDMYMRASITHQFSMELCSTSDSTLIPIFKH